MSITFKGLFFDKKIIKEYVIYISSVFIILNSVILFDYYQIIKQYSINMSSTISRSTQEMGILNLQYICNIAECDKIKSSLYGFDGVTYVTDKRGIIKPSNTDMCTDNVVFESNEFKITTDASIIFFEPRNQITIEIQNEVILESFLLSFFTINFFIMLIFTVLFYSNKYNHKKKQLLMIMGTEGNLREQNMRILTENVHHELNTPVAIIRGTLRNYEIKMLESMTKDGKKCTGCVNTSLDFHTLYYSISQIEIILQRMSNFKQIKYSNGNKTLIDIIRYSANSMNIYKRSNFVVDIDDDFLNYNLLGELDNGDLLNIISNHLRNSLEANSTKILISCKYIEDKKKENRGKLHIFITDNGVGIRDRKTGLPLNKNQLNDVFKPYYSTKDNDGNAKAAVTDKKGIDKLIVIISSWFKDNEDSNEEVRGVGLYLNKQMLLDKSGDLKLRETSSKGTVFEIVVNAKKTETAISQELLFEKILNTD
jgi:signal transduction histidine kinase